MEKENFEHILNQGESVLKTLKPVKSVYQLSRILPYIFLCSLPILIILLYSFVMQNPLMIIVGAVAVIVIIFIVLWICSRISYNKELYIITNQRIIIRSGIVGVDYKSMDIDDINAVEINVGFWDKFCKKNTGKLFFGSPTRPIFSANASSNIGGYSFMFTAVVSPYELGKKIKEFINRAQNRKKQNLNTANQEPNVDVNDIMAQIEKLTELRENGAISQEEFENLKSKIIK